MTKQNKLNINEELELDNIDLDSLNIEEIDKEMDEFYIDKDAFEYIKVPDEMEILIKETIDKAEKDMKKEKIIKRLIPVAASVGIILSIGIYNPVLAHKLPPVENMLEGINNILKVDEIASLTKIDEIIPKATLDKQGEIIFIKAPKYKLNENTTGNIKENKEDENKLDKDVDNDNENSFKGITEENVSEPSSEYEAVQLIHQMSNVIINPIDGRKRGYTEITPKTIELAKEGLKYIQDEGAKSYLQNELNNWQNGDFDNAVSVHNFVWNMLDGDIGKAISVDYEEINKIKNKNFK